MRTHFLWLLVATGMLTTARADLTLVQEIDGSGRTHQMTIKLKGDKARVEITPEADHHHRQQVRRYPEPDEWPKEGDADVGRKIKGDRRNGEQVSKDSSAGAEKGKLIATGKKETMNGYEVEEYVRESASMKETYWIAPKYPDAAAILKQLQSIAPTAWSSVAKGVFDFREFPGLPLKTIVKTDKGEITSSFVSIKQDSLSDADFVVPKDFQELKGPNLQDLLSTKPSAPTKP